MEAILQGKEFMIDQNRIMTVKIIMFKETVVTYGTNISLCAL
jgi:hypothetical protein